MNIYVPRMGHISEKRLEEEMSNIDCEIAININHNTRRRNLPIQKAFAFSFMCCEMAQLH